jgi:hypothetical protein
MKIQNGEKTEHLPDFLIVGAAKSGTTSLYYYLQQHPEICLSKVKEPNYFCYVDQFELLKIYAGNQLIDRQLLPHEHDRAVYCGLFDKPQNRILGETSTNYLALADQTIATIYRIYRDAAPKIKIIIILRQPVQRAWSHYTFHVRNGQEPLPFKEAVSEKVIEWRRNQNLTIGYDYIGLSRYADCIEKYQNAFDKVKIVLFDELKADQDVVVCDLFKFLGIDNIKIAKNKASYNISGKPKNHAAAVLGRLLYQTGSMGRFLLSVMPVGLLAPVKRLRHLLSERLYQRWPMTSEDEDRIRKYFVHDVRKTEKLIDRSLKDVWNI